MSQEDPSKLERIHEFLRKSLLGQELINTQFHLFSARSATSRRFTKPRVLCANNVLLAKNSKYFLDLLSSDINPTDPSLSDLTDDHDVPNNVGVDDYDYASDSDLEDEEEEPPIPVADLKKPKDRSVVSKTSRFSVTRQPKDDDELSQDGSESDSSDIFVMSPEHPEHPRLDELFSNGTGSLTSVTNSETAVQGTPDGDNKGTNHHDTTARLRFLGTRHILVKDTAFQTYYTLLNYLYTGEVSFLPLTSAVAAGGQRRGSSTSSLEEPRCSAKSMYRLASKVGLDRLRDEAFAHIKNNLSKNNILKELSCSFVSRHPELLEMELDVLYSLLTSPPVVAGFPVLAQRIANRELPHGADVIVGIHTRLLRGPLSWVKEPSSPRSPRSESVGISKSESSPASPHPPPGVGTPANLPPQSGSFTHTLANMWGKQGGTFTFGGGVSSSSWGVADPGLGGILSECPLGQSCEEVLELDPGPCVAPEPLSKLPLEQQCVPEPTKISVIFSDACPPPEDAPKEDQESDVDDGFANKKKKMGLGGGGKGKKKKKQPCAPA